MIAPKGKGAQMLLLLVFLGTTSLAGMQSATASQNCRERTIFSKDAAEAIIRARVHDTYVLATRLLLKALLDKRLDKLGFEPPAEDYEVARIFLTLLTADSEPPSTAPAVKAIKWSQVGLVIEHPAKWYRQVAFVGGPRAARACSGYSQVLSCETSDALAASQRGVTRLLLNNAGVCLSADVPKTAIPAKLNGHVKAYMRLLASRERYLLQYKRMTTARNAPFRASGMQHEMLYSDFFFKSLSAGNVAEFVGEYFSSGNPLNRLELHRRAGRIVGLLLDSRIIK